MKMILMYSTYDISLCCPLFFSCRVWHETLLRAVHLQYTRTIIVFSPHAEALYTTEFTVYLAYGINAKQVSALCKDGQGNLCILSCPLLTSSSLPHHPIE